MPVECGRGHLYDPELYSSCPYCNGGTQGAQFSGTPVTADDNKTLPIGGAPAAAAPAYAGTPVTSDSNKTQPPKGYAPAQPAAPKPVPPVQPRVGDDNKTVGLMKDTIGFDPVVGWLVCIEGSEKGADYKLRGQINTIGSGDKNDVRIKGDTTISRENHARLSYSLKTRRYHLMPGEGKNLIYLNGDEIFEATQMQAYDIIDFGKTKLMFVPLCTDKFSWEQES